MARLTRASRPDNTAALDDAQYEQPQTSRRVVVAASIGTFVEGYDLALYAAIAVLPRTPDHEPPADASTSDTHQPITDLPRPDLRPPTGLVDPTQPMTITGLTINRDGGLWVGSARLRVGKGFAGQVVSLRWT